MALTRKMLKVMGIEDEKIDEIIEAHTETVDALKEQRDGYKASADEAADYKKKFEEAEKKLENKDPDKASEEYNKLKQEFDDYKAEVTEKETTAAKTKAYRDLLGKIGLKGDKLVDTILKGVDLKGIEIDEKGIKNAEEIEKTLKEDWKDYISTAGEKGADVETPPAGSEGKTIKPIPTIF